MGVNDLKWGLYILIHFIYTGTTLEKSTLSLKQNTMKYTSNRPCKIYNRLPSFTSETKCLIIMLTSY